MNTRSCDNCGNEVAHKELGRKIGGQYLCKDCKKKKRLEHRKETIEVTGVKDDLRELSNKINRERGYSRKTYAKRKGSPVRSYGEYKKPPIPKGSIQERERHKSEAYLSFQDRQALLSMLMDRGLDFDEAKERINAVVRQQAKIRKDGTTQNKSEENIKLEQQEIQEEMIEGLCNY